MVPSDTADKVVTQEAKEEPQEKVSNPESKDTFKHNANIDYGEHPVSVEAERIGNEDTKDAEEFDQEAFFAGLLEDFKKKQEEVNKIFLEDIRKWNPDENKTSNG